MKTGVNTGIIINSRFERNKGKFKVCFNCKNYKNGFCNKFRIRITDVQNAKFCKEFKKKK